MENSGKILLEDDQSEWYIALGEKWVGPLSAEDVYNKIETRDLTWAHYIWKKGQSGWKRICEVEPFSAAVPVTPPKSTPPPTPKKTTPPPVPKDTPAPTIPKEEKIWFLFYNESQFGPFSTEEINRYIQIGKIHGKVHIWKDGLDDWDQLSEVKEFAPQFKKVKTPPAPKKSDAKSAKKDSGDKREAPRRPLVAKLFIAADDTVVTAVCRDISVGGMQVLTDKLPGKIGDHIKMNVSPAGASSVEPFVAEGVIVRYLEDRRGFSFRFEKLSDKARKAIEKFIQ